MKKSLPLVFLFLLQFPAHSQIVFQKKFYGGAINDFDQTFDGGTIAAGEIYGTQYLLKIDSNGNAQWRKSIEAYYYREGIYSVLQTADTGYILFSSIKYDGTRSSSDGLIFKTDQQGNLMWKKIFHGLDFSSLAGETAYDGGFVFGGTWYDSMPSRPALIKINSSGDTLWAKSFHESGAGPGKGTNSVIPTTDGGYLVLASNDGGSSIIKTDSMGNASWAKKFWTWWPDQLKIEQCRQTPDDGFILIGWRGTLIKTDSNGDTIWTKQYKINNNIIWLSAIRVTQDGGYILCGYTGSFEEREGILIRTDALGNVAWSRNYDLGSYDNFIAVQETHDGFIAAGYESWNKGYLYKTDSSGYSGCSNIMNTITISRYDWQVAADTFITYPVTFTIADSNMAIQDFIDVDSIICQSIGINEYLIENLITVFPNPAANICTISASELHIDEIEIYNSLGLNSNSVTQSSSSISNNDHREIQLDISNLPSGIYFIRLKTEAGLVVKKLLKL